MSVYKDVSFSINRYDSGGDVIDECILLHLGDTILRLSTVRQLDIFINNLEAISDEIKENYILK